MTQKITIISGKSVTEKLAYWFGLSLAGLMFYGGIVSINDCSTNSICERNESSIKALIQARKFDRVRKLLEEYKDLPGGDLRLGDKIILEEMLEQEIQKKNLEDELNNAMTEKNYDLAEKLVAKAKNSGLNVAAYEKTFMMTTEEGLHTLISQATGEKEALIQEYLTLYPEGAHKKEILRYLILEDFKKNVASYLTEELLAYDETINEIDKNLLRIEIEKMKRLLEHYGGN